MQERAAVAVPSWLGALCLHLSLFWYPRLLGHPCVCLSAPQTPCAGCLAAGSGFEENTTLSEFLKEQEGEQRPAEVAVGCGMWPFHRQAGAEPCAKGGAESPLQVSGKPPSGFISTQIVVNLLGRGKIWIWASFCLELWVCLTNALCV